MEVEGRRWSRWRLRGCSLRLGGGGGGGSLRLRGGGGG